MKKKYFLIIPILMSFLLSSCTFTQPKKSVKETDFKTRPVQIAANAEMFFLNNQKLYYFTDEVNSKKPDLAKKTLFEYNLIAKKSKKISSFDDISVYSGSKTLINNNLYIPLATNNENILFEINTEKSSSKDIKKWRTFPLLSFVYYLKNNLILFGPNSLNKSTIEYYINKIDLANKKEVNIVKKQIKNEKGELISCIDVDENNIYAFSIISTDTGQSYNISKYDLDGTQISIYPFDLKTFLNSATLTQDDAIINLYKEKDYFILNTLNGRVFIFKLSNNKLQPIKIPENFYKNNPSGFRFMEYYDGISDFAYFYNTFENNNEIMVFNYTSEKFTSLNFSKDNNMKTYFRNARGDLIVQKDTIQNTKQFDYYYIDKQ